MRSASAIRRFVQVVVRDPQLAGELPQDMARNHWARENRRASVDFDLELIDGNDDDAAARLDTGRFATKLGDIVPFIDQPGAGQQNHSTVADNPQKLTATRGISVGVSHEHRSQGRDTHSIHPCRLTRISTKSRRFHRFPGTGTNNAVAIAVDLHTVKT